MNVEEELRKINFAELSRVKEELLRKILLARKLRREFDRELDLEDLDSVAAVLKKNKKSSKDMLVKIYETAEDLP